MFDLDNWTEIFSTIKKNKMRTFLTGFSISWGIFMFCILLASGNGLKNGTLANFGSRAVNSVEFWGRRTSMPYKGLPKSRRIILDDNDLNLVKEQIPEAEDISGMVYTSVVTNYKTIGTTCQFTGVNTDYQKIGKIKIKQGRFINAIDMKDRRKVAVINPRMSEVLFQKEDPIGKQFTAGGLGYMVIGVYDTESRGDSQNAYIPFSTAQMLYNRGWGIGDIAFTINGLETKEKNIEFEKRFRQKLSVLHEFNPDDERAVGIWNQLENYMEAMGIFNGISLFIWIIGIGTLTAGVISISNIMLITVRERTREFGIRKALGAKPSSILGNILMESIFITSVFGYIGMFLGVGLGELVNSILENMGGESNMSFIFQNPTVEVGVALGAMLILIVSGVIAGYYPAMKAVKISAVEAMKEE
jgi:putative ABC transport system permease protein